MSYIYILYTYIYVYIYSDMLDLYVAISLSKLFN